MRKRTSPILIPIAFALISIVGEATAQTVSWTGPYIGATLGGAWSNSHEKQVLNSTYCNNSLGGCPQTGPLLGSLIPNNFDLSADQLVGGGVVGYNWQMGQLVIGVEADLTGPHLTNTAVQGASGSIPGFATSVVNVQESMTETLSYLGTVRGRLGVPVSDSLLVYATGGFAYGHVKTTTAVSENVTGPCFCGPAVNASVGTSSIMTGWTVGGGLEWQFAPHWSLKGEYLYYDLGSTRSSQLGFTQLNGGATPFFGASVSQSSSQIDGNIVRAGLSYKF